MRDKGAKRIRSSCGDRNLFDQMIHQKITHTIAVADKSEQFCLYRLFDENAMQKNYPQIKNNHQRLQYEFYFFENQTENVDIMLFDFNKNTGRSRII